HGKLCRERQVVAGKVIVVEVERHPGRHFFLRGLAGIGEQMRERGRQVVLTGVGGYLQAQHRLVLAGHEVERAREVRHSVFVHRERSAQVEPLVICGSYEARLSFVRTSELALALGQSAVGRQQGGANGGVQDGGQGPVRAASEAVAGRQRFLVATEQRVGWNEVVGLHRHSPPPRLMKVVVRNGPRKSSRRRSLQSLRYFPASVANVSGTFLPC